MVYGGCSKAVWARWYEDRAAERRAFFSQWSDEEWDAWHANLPEEERREILRDILDDDFEDTSETTVPRMKTKPKGDEGRFLHGVQESSGSGAVLVPPHAKAPTPPPTPPPAHLTEPKPSDDPNPRINLCSAHNYMQCPYTKPSPLSCL